MNWRPEIAGMGMAFLLGIFACGKEDKKESAADSEAAKAAIEATEMQKKNETVARLSSEQQFLDLKAKAIGERLEKQGNKTKKKLKPKFAVIESERGKIAGGLEHLITLAEPDFTSESNAIRVLQDSLSMTLEAMGKSMK